MVHQTNTDNPVDFPKETVDALGKPIRYGQRYGYSSSAGGVARTTVGVAINLTKTKVTLQVEEVKHFLYGEPFEKTWSEDAKTVSIRTHLVFPVNDA